MTRARYTLLEVAERSTVVTGTSFETGRRTNWTFLLNVGRIDGGGSVTVEVESSPSGREDSFEQAYAFAAATSVGTVLKRQRDEGESFAGPLASDLYLRGAITAISGNATVELIAWAPFFDLEDDLDFLPQELREWEDGLVRTVEGAEDDVIRAVIVKGGEGRYKTSLLDARFPDAMRAAIAEQAEHRYRRARLLESTEPTKQVTARDMPTVSPDVYRILDEFLAREVGVWRGR